MRLAAVAAVLGAIFIGALNASAASAKHPRKKSYDYENSKYKANKGLMDWNHFYFDEYGRPITKHSERKPVRRVKKKQQQPEAAPTVVLPDTSGGVIHP